jgi:hypothetical protein
VNKLSDDEFFDCFAALQNKIPIIHNNGRYMNKKSPKEDISYRGQAYHFEYGKPVSYPNPYELLFLEITVDVVDMMEDIILNTFIANTFSTRSYGIGIR